MSRPERREPRGSLARDLGEMLALTNDSEIARTLRHSLEGLSATLQSAAAAADEDPGAELCLRLVEQLRSLLVQGSRDAVAWTAAAAPPPEPAPEAGIISLGPGPTPARREAGGLRLQRLKEDFQNDAGLRAHLGRFALRAGSDGELWGEVGRLLLRLPAREAARYGARAEELAAEAGAVLSEERVERLGFWRDEVIYPGLVGAVEAQGLAFSTGAPLHPSVQAAGAAAELHALACLVSTCLEFADRDGHLRHALRSVQQFDIVPLDAKQKTAYVKDLLYRYGAACSAETAGAPAEIFEACLGLAEAVLSLVYLPPAEAESSWWARLQGELRPLLEASADRARESAQQTSCRWLSGSYEDVYRFTDDSNLQCDEGAGAPGVLACLRPYAQLDGRVMKGRVIYRSRQRR